MDEREKILQERERLMEKLKDVKVMPESAFPKSYKRDWLSETVTTQEQADFIMRQLRWLIRDAEEKENNTQK